MDILLQLALLFLLPFIVSWAAPRLRIEGWLSPVVLCYVCGMIIGNLWAIRLDEGGQKTFTDINENTQQASVILAIPLLLISAKLRVWLSQARQTLISFLLACGAVFSASLLIFFVFPSSPNVEAGSISAMLSGGLTGSALNLNAVGYAIDAPETLIGLVMMADILNGGIYLIFLTSVGQKLLGSFLPKYQSSGLSEAAEAQEEFTGINETGLDQDSSFASGDPGMPFYRRIYGSRREYFGKAWIYLKALALAILIAAMAAGVSLLFLGELHEAVIILTLTALSLGGSLIPQIKRTAGSFELGQYLLLVFCVAIGLAVDFNQLVKASPSVFAYAGALFVCAIVFHYLAARIFRIDADTVLITSTAAIYGPPFVPQVAMALGNRDLVVPGIITALAGYALGNFLGISVAYILGVL
jgi:uncharacterized membrane protein